MLTGAQFLTMEMQNSCHAYITFDIEDTALSLQNTYLVSGSGHSST